MSDPDDRQRTFAIAAAPLIEWLNENVPHPHCSAIVDKDSAELLYGEIAYRRDNSSATNTGQSND